MRIFFVFLLCLLPFKSLISQTNGDPVFLTIGKQNISTSEFERIFNKNNSIATAEKQTLDEYLQMFINFKLKVQAAEDDGLDTLNAFQSELKGYRDQLAKSYLTDNRTVDSLVMEAYQRMHTEVSASHIMTALNVNAPPTDTLEAWNKIMSIRKRLINGEDFDNLAFELSDDPSAKNNRGNLGYFSAFQMVYPFENAAYNCKVGEISQPVRSRFGYHILRTNDKRPARGEVKVAHIMLMVPQGSPDSIWTTAEKNIKTLEQQLKAGADFASLAREKSEDRGSARNGGELPVFGTGRMVPEFEEAAFKLQYPGDISAPVRTFYGWHLIKLLEKKGIPEFEQIKQELKSKINRDERAEYGSISFVNGLKKGYSFFENKALLGEFIETPAPVTLKPEKKGPKQALMPDKVMLSPKLKTDINPQKAEEILFKFADQSYQLAKFAGYLKTLPQPDSAIDPVNFVNNAYQWYVRNQMLAYEDKMLETKHADFRNLVQEYHDGILLFNLSDSLVWTKASKDTAGLENFFRANQQNYMWPQRIEATIVIATSPETAQKAAKAARKLLTAEKLEKELTKTICDTTAKEPCISMEYNKFAKGDHFITDTVKWKKGVSQIISKDGKYYFAVAHNLLESSPKTLDESRGLAISDYQDHLEKEWVASLRKKYTVTVNNDIFKQLKTKYEGKN